MSKFVLVLGALETMLLLYLQQSVLLIDFFALSFINTNIQIKYLNLMKKNSIIKQITITERDIVDLIQFELYNTGLLEDMEKQEIKQLDTLESFKLIQSYCDNNIETVLRSFKTGLDDMELEEFEHWFGFNSEGYLRELKGLLE